MTKSPRLSFKKYNILKALYRNKDAVKVIIVLIAGAGYLTGFELQSFLLALGAGVITLLGKLLLDAFEYFFTEVEV